MNGCLRHLLVGITGFGAGLLLAGYLPGTGRPKPLPEGAGHPLIQSWTPSVEVGGGASDRADGDAGSAQTDSGKWVSGAGWRRRLAAFEEEAAGLDAAALVRRLGERSNGGRESRGSMGRLLLLSRLAELEPETALGVAFGDGTRGGRGDAREVRAVMEVWAEGDPSGSADYFARNADDFGILEKDQRELAAGLASSLASSDPEEAVRWVFELGEEMRGEALAALVETLGRDKMGRVSELLGTLPPGFERTELLQSIAGRAVADDPVVAAEWVGSLPGEVERAAAARAVVEGWSWKEPAAAAAWVTSLAPGKVRDEAAAALVMSPGFQVDAVTAYEWVASIRDTAVRAGVLDRAGARWPGGGWDRLLTEAP